MNSTTLPPAIMVSYFVYKIATILCDRPREIQNLVKLVYCMKVRCVDVDLPW